MKNKRSKKYQAEQRLLEQQKRSDRQKSTCLIILRNLMIFYTAYIGHDMNFGDHFFWRDYCCNSTDNEAHEFALKMHLMQLMTHLLFCHFMRFDGMSLVLFLLYALTWPLPVVVDYDASPFFHQFFSVITAATFLIHITYELLKRKQICWKRAVFVASYFIALITMGVSMDWGPFLNFRRGVRAEWFMITSGMTFQTLLAMQS